MNSTKLARGACQRGVEVPVTLQFTRAQIETAIRAPSSLVKKLIAARAKADLQDSFERAARLKNWK